jgi:hypothetical protein
VKPPAVNKNKKPIANNEAVVGLEDPPYRVETQLNWVERQIVGFYI